MPDSFTDRDAPPSAQAGGHPCRGSLPFRVETAGHASLLQVVRDMATGAAGAGPPGSRLVLRRFAENARVLRDAYRRLSRLGDVGGKVPAEAEWLLDNYYVVEDVVREVKTDLPASYYRELPALAAGPNAGLPRIYPLAATVLAYTDSSLTEAQIRVAVAAYQEAAPLTTGEIWAVPTVFRLALLENLRRLADAILAGLDDRAAVTAALAAVRTGGRPALPAAPSDAYAAAVWDGLRDNEPPPGPAADAVQEWAARHLADPAQVFRSVHVRQAADQVSIGNAVTSLRLLNVVEWADFFEAVSPVECVLRDDPGYVKQDFATRDRCRRAVERLAKGCKKREDDVARRAVKAAAEAGGDPVRGHVSWPLIGDGLPAFEAAVGYRPKWADRRREFVLRHPHLVYFGLLAAFTAGGVALAVWLALPGGVGAAVAAGLFSLFLASEVGVGATNFMTSRLVPPRVLPRLDFRAGVPEGCATFVVMPTLIGKPEHAADVLERLEQHHLSNPDPRLWFALLTDFADAPAETMPTDAACVRAALDGVKRLNDLYAAGGPPRFFLLHRKRLWNPAEGKWMGHERKRGKLDEFNALIRGATDTTYAVQSHPAGALPKVRYVFTLDTDTVLPRDAARQMIATLAHPLSRPQLSADGRRVERGYAVLQPRVSFLYRTGFRSWFARVFAGSAGVDPYSAAVSDTYMDLFGKGTFTGKGLYDVDAFRATAGRAFPDNAILSHDLIESNYGRCALASDVEVFDEFPARYHAFAKRDHRWARGDWQLVPWLGRTVPTPGGRGPNVLPLLERWKVFDNLRRSLVPAAAVAVLLLGWSVLPGPAWAWTLIALAPFLLPTTLFVSETALNAVTGTSRALYARVRADLLGTVGQAALTVVFLANHAWLLLDAVGRTLHRVFVSRRKMLEWETAAAAESRLGAGASSFVRTMWPAVATAAAGVALVWWSDADNLVVAGPFLLLWLLSPLVAWAVSRPRSAAVEPLTAADRAELRAVARKTWDFFETFVGPADHWLPPDNFQEDPLGVVAHRTSPTNIGLYFLSTLAAHDMGYVPLRDVADRLAKGFDALDKLETHRGHFHNWYDTAELRSLPPAYVSTVDSGNLLACLLALKHGIAEKVKEPEPPVADGLLDTLAVFRREWESVAGAAAGTARAKVADAVREADAAVRSGESVGDFVGRAEALDALVHGAVRADADAARWSGKLAALARRHRDAAAESAEAKGELAVALEAVAGRADRMAAAMDFRFLYNPQRELFSIGYNAVTDRLDGSHYDLLASEACITSFLAVARGQVPRKHWFRLGRLVQWSAGEPGLVSWGGTLFEYLMPRLLLPAPQGVLLDQAQRAAVRRQIGFGREQGRPWGVSESGFYLFDAGQVYQYQSFGVPGLGLKRGLEKDHVVAPYATLLAADVFPHEAVANLARLRSEGGEGRYGFHEAIDYDPIRAGGGHKVVKSYMAHHQGMALLAVVNRLTGGITRKRLGAEPAVRAAELLLEERVPYEAAEVETGEPSAEVERAAATAENPSRRRITTPDTPNPRTHLLSNGRYTVMVTNSGGGFSRCGDHDVSRWKPDRTTDDCGPTVYVRDRKAGTFWSAGYQPTRRRPDGYEVTFALDKVDLRRVDDGIETLTEVTVIPNQDVEVRRVTLTNHGDRTRELDVTSFVEVVLNPHAADAAHPAFGKLFLETEWLPEHAAILCRRRPRSPDQPPAYAVHVFAGDTDHPGAVSFDTDRSRFVGRRRTPADPAALQPRCDALSGSAGPVLDPVFAIRTAVKLKPGDRATVAFSTCVASSREEAVARADQYHTGQAVTRAFELAWAHARIELEHAGTTPDDVHLFQRLGGHLLYPTGPLRAPSEVLAANRQGQPGLWKFGISGDLPVALLRLNGPGGLDHLRHLLKAHAYWRAKGLRADFAVLLDAASGYQDDLFTEAVNVVRAAGFGDLLDKSAGIFVRKTSQMPEADRVLLLASARAVIDDRTGTLAAQADAVDPPRTLPPRRPSATARPKFGRPDRPLGLSFWNGLGGFSADGREYVIATDAGDLAPPAPWSNVVANPAAGFLLTDAGGGFAWAGNSQSNRLTPWSNDPVADPPGDVIYVQDDATGAVWCPTPLPIRDGGPVVVRHGQGYTAFERTVNGVEHRLTAFVPLADPVKVSVLRLRNGSGKAVRFNLAYYAEWVLGTTREANAQHVVTEWYPGSGVVLARNPFSPDAGAAVAFAAVSLRPVTVTGDRVEFVGRNGSLSYPAALDRTGLSGRVGPRLDPCAALHGAVDVPAGETRTVVFALGQAADADAAVRLARLYTDAATASETLKAVIGRWDHVSDAVRVETPDPAFDVMMNRWLPYQTLACRVWGRSAFYQSGGAYGFRDQLQDVLALLHSAPDLTRAQLLRAAAHQFAEGDVQHWWHEPAGNGVRTRFSDDFLWLPYAVAQYVSATRDTGVLDERVPFLQSPPLGPDEHERYEVPSVSSESGTLYDHCVRALDHGWKLGAHGLPLMGVGDWNDGMNAVGVGGKGESVWVAWFQVVCLSQFADVATFKRDTGRAETCRTRAEELRKAVDEHAWDGQWYRRAYFDDGTPLGSAQNDECRIDSLAQSWAVIAGGADPERAALGMDEVMMQLVRPASRLVLLFAPPFDAGPLRPGYIKGYVPGVRENGGQYTHAACWVVKALAGLGRTEAAHATWDLLNPVRAADTPASVDRYRGEPYVVAADVYGRPPHVGRAGWTWYTGSAGWLYRVGLEDVLGVTVADGKLRVAPCVPAGWPGFTVRLRHHNSTYRVVVSRSSAAGPPRVWVDGQALADAALPLTDDGREHEVRVEIGSGPPAP